MGLRSIVLLSCAGCTSSLPTGSSIVAEACPTSLAVDGTAVYWVDRCDGTIKQAPKAGGAPTTLVSNEPEAARLSVDDAWLYWQRGPNSAPGIGAIVRAPKSGGSASELVSGITAPFNLTIDDTNVYWTALKDGALMAVPKDATGGAHVVATSACPSGLQAESASGFVYWLDCSTFYRQPATGGASEVLFDIDPASSGSDGYLLSNDSLFYWILYATGDVTARVALYKFDTATQAQTLIQDHGTLPGLATSSHFYWVLSTDIVRAPLAGGDPQAIVHTGGATTIDLINDDRYLYWALAEADGIFRAQL